jgi:ATP-binding cassette subfamily B protein
MNLPNGLQESLGEGGGRLSGGEGQRVRLGRALSRPDSKLIILDEPFRGLDRPLRRELVARIRRFWSGATILCVMHDIAEAQQFNRVLVVDDGRIVEDGVPDVLLADPHSRYSSMLATEESVRKEFWSGDRWRRSRLVDGELVHM